MPGAGRRARRPAAAERGSAEFELRRAFEAVTARAARAGRRRARAAACSTTCTTPGWPPSSCCTSWPGSSAGARLLVLATMRAEEGADALEALADVTDRLDLGPLAADGGAPARRRRRAGRAGRGHHAPDPRAHAVRRRDVAGGWRPATGRARVAAGGGAGPAAAGRARRPRSCCGPARCSAPPWIRRRSRHCSGIPPLRGRQRCERRSPGAAAGRWPGAATSSPTTSCRRCSTRPRRPRSATAHHRRAADLLTGRPEAGRRARRRGRRTGRGPRAPAARRGAGAGRRFAPPMPRRCSARALEAAERADDAGAVGRAHLARGRPGRRWRSSAAAFDDLRAALAAARHAGDRTPRDAGAARAGRARGPRRRGRRGRVRRRALLDGLRIAESRG